MKNRGLIPYYNRNGFSGKSSSPYFNSKVHRKGEDVGRRSAYRNKTRIDPVDSSGASDKGKTMSKSSSIHPNRSGLTSVNEKLPKKNEADAATENKSSDGGVRDKRGARKGDKREEKKEEKKEEQKEQGLAAAKHTSKIAPSRKHAPSDSKMKSTRSGYKGKSTGKRDKIEVERMDSLFNELELLDEHQSVSDSRSESRSVHNRSKKYDRQ
ncbi:hypothetical protein [Paenibacillus sp. J2TS4]|uniref:hypothetical protein n=1 Tax=Paenibacillus sp. J2TS4 TaxID=2807194 RepID=UPI001B17561F|nr:hypothetical protein [Paenibacillus sp. J2TS4]GIP31490.1 hypothetical protein J2TS4_07000 [Paenibacillus sp. J2TS4]